MLMGDGGIPSSPISSAPCTILSKIVETEKATETRPRPIILCEYAHAMGNSNGNASIYWRLFRSAEHPRIQGGFVWDWVDNALEDEQGNWAYGGDFGPESGAADATFCINGLVLPDRSVKPGLLEFKYLHQAIEFGGDIASVTCSAFNHCPPAADLEFSYEIHALDVGGGVVGGNACSIEGLDVLPRDNFYSWTCKLSLKGIDDAMKEHGGRALSVVIRAVLGSDKAYAAKGHVVAYEQYDVLAAASPSSVDVQLDGGSVEMVKGDSSVEVKTSSYKCSFDLKTGKLTAVSSADGSVLVEGFSHTFFRAPTDNDVGGFDTMLPNEFLKNFVSKSQTSLCGLWRRAGLDNLQRSLVEIEVDVDELSIEVTEEFVHKRRARYFAITTFTFEEGSIAAGIKVEASSSLLRITPSLPRVGVVLQLPASSTSSLISVGARTRRIPTASRVAFAACTRLL